MGHWGVKSYENDDADEALDAGFERAHGDAYDTLMDDRNPLPFDQVQARLAGPDTLAAALDALAEAAGAPFEEWDDLDRLAYAGVVVRHAELGVAVPDDARARALGWLEGEAIDWPEATLRRARRDKEIRLLRAPSAPPTPPPVV
jgi:hypothetical protein